MADMSDKRSFIEHLATLPATNFTVFVGQGLAVLFVAFDLIGIAAGWITPENDSTLYLPAGFIAAMLGLAVTQFGIKRATFDPSTLGMKREDVDPSPAAPAVNIVNSAQNAAPTPDLTSAVVLTFPDLSKPATGDSKPRNQQDERGD